MSARAGGLPSLLVATVLAVAGVTAAAEPRADARHLARALEEARSGDWAGAARFGARAKNALVDGIILWMRLREGEGNWAEYRDFLEHNGDWPNTATIRMRGERMIPADASPAEVIAYFGEALPRTGKGALALAEALAASGQEGAAAAMLRRAWPSLLLGRTEQAALISRYGDLLARHHVARLDNLLWEERLTEASAMLPHVDAGWQALARARIGLRRDAGDVDRLIAEVPAVLARDPGLAYERYQWRLRKGRWEEAEDWLLRHSRSAAALGRPELWMARRAWLARLALGRGEVERAYRLVAENFGSEGGDLAEAEWYAGYVALTRMNEPDRAIRHFERFERVVSTPISLGRAGFWLGRAHEAAGRPEEAAMAYARAAAHQTSFYGQLAAEQAGIEPDAALAANDVSDWRRSGVVRRPVVAAGYLLHLAGEEGWAVQFFRHAAESLPPAERAALAQMAIDLDRPHVGLRLAKDAATAGVVLPGQYYPMHAIAEESWAVPTEFALAIARQESEFDPGAQSPAGARGLMQLMPGTAEAMSRVAGVDYDPGRLTRDPLYNARLGTTYLAEMLEAFDGSYILAAAAYNAGPGRVRRWLEEHGDPREPDVDVVNWIESIPYGETRNYVMRVLEALHVYRARLAGQPQPMRLVADVNRSG